MIQLAFTVYDSAAEAYLEPFFAVSRGAAIRSFKDAIASDGHPFNRHTADYTLFAVGGFDTESGVFLPESPVSLGNGVEYADGLEVAS